MVKGDQFGHARFTQIQRHSASIFSYKCLIQCVICLSLCKGLYPLYFKLHVRWLSSFTPITYWCKLLGLTQLPPY
ncbi:hypothetical protein DN756_10000 [Yersinia pseudotuberculosis]|nr:hypothetical protein DN756_10000 [Yersinia pseudotuberculosis]